VRATRPIFTTEPYPFLFRARAIAKRAMNAEEAWQSINLICRSRL
jgi:hypothetical protein